MNDDIELMKARLDRLESDFQDYKKSNIRPDHSSDEMEKFISDWFEKQIRPGGLLHK